MALAPHTQTHLLQVRGGEEVAEVAERRVNSSLRLLQMGWNWGFRPQIWQDNPSGLMYKQVFLGILLWMFSNAKDITSILKTYSSKLCLVSLDLENCPSCSSLGSFSAG